ncbi:MAG: mechanosensitive ion channel, partial [Hydrogenophaga sp.]|nr:mechanosensitive ion channel [Hydrogenophaga sp.]
AFDDISVSISYSEKDPAKIKKILEGVVAGHPLVLKSPKPVVRLDGFGDYGYQFIIRGYVSSVHTLALLEIASDVRIALVSTLQQEGIELASVVVSIIGQGDAKKNGLE